MLRKILKILFSLSEKCLIGIKNEIRTEEHDQVWPERTDLLKINQNQTKFTTVLLPSATRHIEKNMSLRI